MYITLRVTAAMFVGIVGATNILIISLKDSEGAQIHIPAGFALDRCTPRLISPFTYDGGELDANSNLQFGHGGTNAAFGSWWNPVMEDPTVDGSQSPLSWTDPTAVTVTLTLPDGLDVNLVDGGEYELRLIGDDLLA